MLYGNSGNGYGYSPDRSRDVDRFNESTRANYSYFDPCKLNNETYKVNNNQYKDSYTYRKYN